MHTEAEHVGLALARVPSGCSILTVEHAGRATGVLVSWVQQASLDPPMVSVCLRKGRPAEEMLASAGRFLLNVIGEEDTTLLRHFARGFAPGENAFAGVQTRSTAFGPAVEGSIAMLGCNVESQVTAGDHVLYLAAVRAAEAIQGTRPLVHIRKSGLSY